MHDLVAEHTIGFGQRRRKRHRDPPLGRLGHASDGVGKETGHDVGLRELRLAAVEHQRLPPVEGVPEDAGKARVPTLGELHRQPRGLLLARVVVDIEVLGAEHAEIEVGVFDFVPAEVLRVSATWSDDQSEPDDNGAERADHTSIHFLRG